MTEGPPEGSDGSRTGRAWPRTAPEVLLLVRVAGLLLLLRALLFSVKLKTLVRWLDVNRGARTIDRVTLEKAARYVDALLARMPSPTRGNCLPRSLALFYFARRSGVPVRLHCGVRRVGERLEGHAWLSLQGQPFLETTNPEQSYRVTFSYPEIDGLTFTPGVGGASGDQTTEPALHLGPR
jgi:Transglutaminase-like superfamily